MKITSTAFEKNQKIPEKYTCKGENINPPLSFSEVPEGAKCLALIVDDPDAPSGTFTHWIVWNIFLDELEIKEGKEPYAVQGTNDFGSYGYGGPCPPSGTHRYVFTLYALNTFITVYSGATREQVTQAMEGHIIETAKLVGVVEKE